MLAATGTAVSFLARRRRFKSKIVNAPKIARPATDQITFACGIETSSAMSPNTISPTGAQNGVRPPGRQVAPGAVAVGPETGDERSRGPGGVPQRRRVGLCVGVQDRTERQSEQQPQAEQRRGRQLVVSASGRDAEGEHAGNAAAEERGFDLDAEIAADACPERDGAEREGDEAHDLTERGPRAIGTDNSGATGEPLA
jgi:hypothetical protein